MKYPEVILALDIDGSLIQGLNLWLRFAEKLEEDSERKINDFLVENSDFAEYGETATDIHANLFRDFVQGEIDKSTVEDKLLTLWRFLAGGEDQLNQSFIEKMCRELVESGLFKEAKDVITKIQTVYSTTYPYLKIAIVSATFDVAAHAVAEFLNIDERQIFPGSEMNFDDSGRLIGFSLVSETLADRGANWEKLKRHQLELISKHSRERTGHNPDLIMLEDEWHSLNDLAFLITYKHIEWAKTAATEIINTLDDLHWAVVMIIARNSED